MLWEASFFADRLCCLLKIAFVNASAKKIKKSVVLELIEQNKAMRRLLEEWPAREIMMDYEKEWNEKREEILNKYKAIDLEL